MISMYENESFFNNDIIICVQKRNIYILNIQSYVEQKWFEYISKIKENYFENEVNIFFLIYLLFCGPLLTNIACPKDKMS